MDVSKIKMLVQHVSLATLGGALLLGGNAAFAGGGHHHDRDSDSDSDKSYTLSGPCAFLPAARATEFHGNADRSKLNLAMAGNQWVVAEEAIQAFNVYIGKGTGTEPAYRPNPGWTLEALNLDENRMYAQYIPPGQLVKQISSGCMTLGNDEDRNFLAGNVQVDFDVFASTNYTLMRNLAKKGFVSEAVPYIKNRLDLMVGIDNPKEIGTTDINGDAGTSSDDPEFDMQFDIIMDLLSGDVIASSLDHINEGIHKASNGYMINAHKWIKSHDRDVTMGYTYADNTMEPPGTTMAASAWIQAALAKVAKPMAGSPGANRLNDAVDNPLKGDAGEKHSGNGHDLAQNGCGSDAVEGNDGSDGNPVVEAVPADYLFCEFAVLNKANTHESRVHHVETPNGIVNADGYEPVDVGFVWITELAYQINHDNPDVTGMNGRDISNLGIPRPADGPKVNSDKTYSLGLLATSDNERRGQQFIDFLRSPEGQLVYTNGGFTGLTDAELAGGEVYDCDGDGVADEIGLIVGSTTDTEAKPQTCF